MYLGEQKNNVLQRKVYNLPVSIRRIIIGNYTKTKECDGACIKME